MVDTCMGDTNFCFAVRKTRSEYKPPFSPSFDESSFPENQLRSMLNVVEFKEGPEEKSIDKGSDGTTKASNSVGITVESSRVTGDTIIG